MLPRKMAQQQNRRTWQVAPNYGRQKGDVMETGDERDMLMEQLDALQQSLLHRIKNLRKEPKPSNHFIKT